MKTGRNDPCPCGSGKKYKHCCYAKDSVKHEAVAEENDQEDTSETPHAPDSDSQRSRKASHEHEKSAPRFPGDKRGPGASFIPRTSRGSQRGH
jgi:hypothetical protein